MKPIRFTRRPLGVGALLAATALALTACSADAGGRTSTSASANPDASLVFGITADPTQTLPWTMTSKQSFQVFSQIYTPLLSTDTQDRIIGNLAELPKVSDDGLTYTFTLRDGLKFTDGSTLDSEDVKYTYETIMNPDSAASSRSYFTSVDSIEAPSPTSVVIKLKSPDSSFISGLTVTSTGIVPADVPVEKLQTQPVGSGPYKWAERVANESITLERNDDYFLGKPGVAKLEFRVIPDAQAMVSALKTGSVQVAVFDNPVIAKTAAANTTTTAEVGSLDYHVLQLRADSPALQDVNRRLAIQCAISRQEVIDSAALGSGTPTGPITSTEYRSDPNAQPCAQQDVNTAKDYLAKAGVPDGFKLNLITSQGLYSTAVDEAQNVQAQLAKVGIEVTIDTLDSGAYVKKWLAGDFDAAIASNGGFSDPNTMYARYFTTDGSFNKVAGFRSAELDDLFAQGIATTDTAKRKEIYARISDQLTSNAAWVWLFSPKYYIVLNSAVNNFVARTDAGLTDLWMATLAK